MKLSHTAFSSRSLRTVVPHHLVNTDTNHLSNKPTNRTRQQTSSSPWQPTTGSLTLQPQNQSNKNSTHGKDDILHGGERDDGHSSIERDKNTTLTHLLRVTISFPIRSSCRRTVVDPPGFSGLKDVASKNQVCTCVQLSLLFDKRSKGSDCRGNKS